MQAVVADAMAGGAIGFASSASPTHNGDKAAPYPPVSATSKNFAPSSSRCASRTRGVVALLPGGVISHDEVFEPAARDRSALHLDGSAHRAGLPVPREGDGRPRRGMGRRHRSLAAGVVPPVGLPDEPFGPFTLNMRPMFAALMGKSKEERFAAFRDPAWREKALAEAGGAGGGHPRQLGEHRGRLVGLPPRADRQAGARAGRRAGLLPLDVVLDISLDDDLEARFWSVLANNDEEGIAWLLPRDNVLLGLADSGAHVSQLCDACFSTDLLGNWVRGRGVMPLERAIHKLTGEPAQVYGLADRGTVTVGKAADICVFDPETIAPGPLRRIYDFPAHGERLTADTPIGVTHTLVNGVPIRVDGVPSDEGLAARPGEVLRR